MNKETTPEQMRKIIRNQFNTLIICLIFYYLLSVLFPTFVSFLLLIHMIVGTAKFQDELHDRGGALNRMGHTFGQCLKVQTMILFWPIAIKALKEQKSLTN